MLPGDRSQAMGNLVERFVPAHFHPLVANALLRLTQPIRIFVQILQRHCLRADVAARQGIRIVAADRHDVSVAHAELKAANGLAQIAGAVMSLFVAHVPRSEEPTYELQSLMRISYAVFCL